MIRAIAFAVGICMTLSAQNVTLTGWFSDSTCASARAASGTFSATNPECARKYIENGAGAVFISEQAKAVFKVKDYPSVIDDLGYQVEVTATLDEVAKTISIQKVKRLSSYQGPACMRPKKPTAKQ